MAAASDSGGKAAAASSSGNAVFANKARSLVVDAGPIIARASLWTMGQELVTVDGVLREIRDPGARDWLERAPVPITPRVPSAQAVAVVGAAARETGDYSALSSVDVSVIALAWQLHAEAHGRLGSSSGESASKKQEASPGEATVTVRVWSKPAPWAQARPAAATTSSSASSATAQTEEEEDEEAEDAMASNASEQAAAAAAAASSSSSSATPRDISADAFADDDDESVADLMAALDPHTRAARELEDSDRAASLAAGCASAASSSAVAAASSGGASSFPSLASASSSASSSATSAAFPSLGSLSAAGKLVPEAVQGPRRAWMGPPRKTAGDTAPSPAAAAASASDQQVVMEGDDEDEEDEEEDEEADSQQAAGTDERAGEATDSTGAEEAVEEEEEDVSGGWVTPASLKATQKRGGNVAELGLGGLPSSSSGNVSGPRSLPAVACVTTDFACQNVLLHLKVPVIGLDGRRVKRLRRWVLKCDACFTVTPEMGRLFCPQCGGSTLRRLACTRTNKGRTIFHYSRHKADPSIRGTQYSLPRPTGGRKADLLLREDQLLTGKWKQRAKAGAKPRESLLAEAAAASFAGEWSTPDAKPASRAGRSAESEMLANVRGAPSVVVGMGRNPNASKGRERRGQKRSKRPGGKRRT